MKFLPGGIYHVYNQGNNQQPIFLGRDNYLLFLKKMRKHLVNQCNILTWCLMPNHFHWLISIPETNSSNSKHINVTSEISGPVVPPLNRSISIVLSSYTRAINKTYNKTGSLFRARTKAKSLTNNLTKHDNYPLICFLYILQNPLRAGLVNNLEMWEFSSYRDFIDIRNGSLCNIKLARELLDLPKGTKEFIKFSNQSIPEHFLKKFL